MKQQQINKRKAKEEEVYCLATEMAFLALLC